MWDGEPCRWRSPRRLRSLGDRLRPVSNDMVGHTHSLPKTAPLGGAIKLPERGANQMDNVGARRSIHPTKNCCLWLAFFGKCALRSAFWLWPAEKPDTGFKIAVPSGLGLWSMVDRDMRYAIGVQSFDISGFSFW